MLHSLLLYTVVTVAQVSIGAPVAERYYMIVFAAQRGWNRPKYAHTFATFVKETSGASKPQHEVLTISWIGTAPRYHLFGDKQPGRNMTLQESLERCRARGQRVTMWGPYEIQPELYRRAAEQKARLERGELGWQALDKANRRNGTAVNCFHSISDLYTENGLLITGFARGDAASQMVVQHLQPFIIDPCRIHEPIVEVLGLHEWPIRRMLPVSGGQRWPELSSAELVEEDAAGDGDVE